MSIKTAAVVTIALGLASATAASSQQTISKGKSISGTATIQAIDSSARTVTLKDKNGQEDVYALGPEVKRFSELKVGDTVNTTYYESVVLQIRKAGGTPGATSTSGAVTPGSGANPGGTMAVQEKMTVTVKSIDPELPSITVTTPDGRTVTRRVEDKKNLEGVSPGDLVDVTYTRAVLMSIDPAR
jgi:Cu/Ag efflux protein CusF